MEKEDWAKLIQFSPTPSVASLAHKRLAEKALETSSFNMAYGSRSVKAYPVTDVDLNSLGTMSLLCTLAFSAGTGLAGIAFDITASLSMSAGVDPRTVGFWSGIQLFSAIGAVVLWATGGGIYLRRRAHIGNIKRETNFD